MTGWREEFEEAVGSFIQVATLAGARLAPDDLSLEILPAPHRQPSRLPAGKMAIYAFWGDGCWLKVGMAGPNSNARYTSQHYNAGSAPSTLAASVTRWSADNPLEGFEAGSPGDWLRGSCHRANVLLSSEHPRELLALLEAFLHLRLRPRHER